MFSTAYRPGQCGFHCHSAYAVPICLLHWATWCVEPDGNVTYVLKFYVSKFHKSILIFRPVHSSTRGVFLTLSSLSNGETLFYVLVQTSPFIRIGFVPSKKLNKKSEKLSQLSQTADPGSTLWKQDYRSVVLKGLILKHGIDLFDHFQTLA